MRIRKTLLYAAATALVLAAGCGRTQMDKDREQARQRWAVSRAEIITKLAEGCFARGEMGRAREHIDDGLRSGVLYAPMYVLAARLAADRGDLDAARSYAENARTIDPKSADARYVLGTVEQTLGEPERAVVEFTEAAGLDPNQAKYVLAQAELLVARDQSQKAADVLAAAAERMPGRAEIHAALGDVLVVLKRHQDAVGSYRIAVRMEPQRTDFKERLATALYYSGSYAEAEPLLAELAMTQPDFAAGWIIEMRAECLMALGRLPQARGLYRALSDVRRDAAGPRVGMAKCDILDNDLPSARRCLEEALARDPQHCEANALMGYVLVEAGRPGEAAPHLALALKDPQCAGRATIERLLAQAKGSQ
jgi:tetratricopeptide (TPR) repeat protein